MFVNYIYFDKGIPDDKCKVETLKNSVPLS